MLFMSSKKLFSLSRYLNFCISVFPFFFPASHWLRGWWKINLKVYDVSNCLNKNLITHFAWYLEKGKRYNIELCQLIEYSVGNIFMEKNFSMMQYKMVLELFQKLHPLIYASQFVHDIINYPTFIHTIEYGKCWKKEINYNNLNISRRKSFLDEI